VWPRRAGPRPLEDHGLRPFRVVPQRRMARDLDHDHQARGKGRCGTNESGDPRPGRSAAASWCRGGPGVSLHSEDHGLGPFRVVQQPWMAGDLDHDQEAQHDSKSGGTADRAAGDTRARQTAPPGDTRARQTAPPGDTRARQTRAAGDTRARQTRAAGDTRARQTLAPATPGRGGSVAHGAVDAQGRSALPDFRTPATGSRYYSSARVVLASVSSSANAPRIASSESLTCEASVTPSVSTPASAAVVLNSNSLA